MGWKGHGPVSTASKPLDTVDGRILHHFETMGIHCLLVFTGESSFQGFLGAKWISSIHSLMQDSHRSRPPTPSLGTRQRSARRPSPSPNGWTKALRQRTLCKKLSTEKLTSKDPNVEICSILPAPCILTCQLTNGSDQSG